MSNVKRVEFIALIIAAICILQISAQRASSRRAKQDNNGQNCTNHRAIIDTCASQATYSYTSTINTYPITLSEMRVSCGRITDAVKCLRTNGKCLNQLAKRSLTAYSQARSKHSKRLCANLNDAKTLDFMKLNECVRAKRKEPTMIELERELIIMLQHLAASTNMEWNDRFHRACCAADEFQTRASKTIEPECIKYKSSHDEMLESMVGELLEVACPEKSRLNDICAKLTRINLPKTWRPVSLASVTLDLIISLGDTEKDKQ